MGSFNVACGITRLTIGYGEDCVLLPLITPKNYGDKEFKRLLYAKHKSVSSFVYAYDMWQPFCLPIRGKYNDYGSIENIVKDENTNRLEQYFNMSIEDLVELITDGRRNVYDKYSYFNKMFYNYPEDLSYDANLDTFLIHLGFEQKDNIYILDNCHIVIDNKTLKTKWNENSIKEYRSQSDFLNDFLKIKGYYLGIKDIDKFKELICVGGMFILGEVYDFYAKNHLSKNENLSKSFCFNRFILNGAKFETNDYITYVKKINNKEVVICYKGEYNKTINGEKFHDMADFLERYKQITKRNFPISRYSGLDLFDWNMLEKKYIGLNCFKILVKKESYLLDEYEIPNWENKEEVMNFIDYYNKEFGFFNIDMIIPHCSFLNEFTTICDIYLSSLLVGDLLEKFSEFERLIKSMILTNVLFIPSFCGTQYGCNGAEVKLAYITNEVVNKRQKELEENTINFKQLNPMEGFNLRFY